MIVFGGIVVGAVAYAVHGGVSERRAGAIVVASVVVAAVLLVPTR